MRHSIVEASPFDQYKVLNQNRYLWKKEISPVHVVHNREKKCSFFCNFPFEWHFGWFMNVLADSLKPEIHSTPETGSKSPAPPSSLSLSLSFSLSLLFLLSLSFAICLYFYLSAFIQFLYLYSPAVFLYLCLSKNTIYLYQFLLKLNFWPLSLLWSHH